MSNIFYSKASVSQSYWSKDDDEKLIQLRSNNYTWSQISKKLKKNIKQCSYRYYKIKLSSKTRWDETQELRLVHLVDSNDKNFELVKKFFPESTVKELKFKYYKELYPRIFSFSIEEDQVLKELIHTNKINSNFEEMLKIKGWLSIKQRLSILMKLKGNQDTYINNVLSQVTEAIKSIQLDVSHDTKINHVNEVSYDNFSSNSIFLPSIDQLSDSSKINDISLLEGVPALYTINFSLFQDIPKENGNFVKDLTDASTNIRLLDYDNQKSHDDYDYHNYIINPNQAEEVILKKQTKVEYLDCLNVLQKKLENIKCQLKFTVS